MGDIQDTSGHFFIYICIVHVSSVSTTTCIDHDLFMVSFLNEMNYLQQFLVYFYDRKSKPIKPTEQFISPIKYLRGNKDFRKSRIAFDVSLKVNRWARKFP